MAKVLCVDYGDCVQCICKSLDSKGDGCTTKFDCEKLYNAGYRKASDVAREIFEEIEDVLQPTILALFCISEALVDVSKSHITEEKAINYIRECLHGTISSRYRLKKAFEPIKKKYESEGEK